MYCDFISHDFQHRRPKCIWVLCFKWIGMLRREQRVRCWYLALSCNTGGTQRGGADPPPSYFPGGSIDSVSPRRDGDVRRAAACSVNDSEENQTWENRQQLKGDARFGDPVDVPQWAAELWTTGLRLDGTWLQPGSCLWPSALPYGVSEDHRWSWTPRYCCV